MSRECLYGLGAPDILATLSLPSALPGESLELPGRDNVKVKFGLSAALL